MRLVIIDSYDSFTWNLVHYFEEITNTSVTVLRNDQVDLVQLLDFEGVVLSPGPGLPAESGELLEIIRYCIGKKPLLGVCLGLQGIVEVYGGTLIQLPQVMHGLQRNCRQLLPDSLFENIPVDFQAGRYHSWVADPLTFPQTLQVIAEDDQGTIMAIRDEVNKVYAVQFHPESIMTPFGKMLLRNWINKENRS